MSYRLNLILAATLADRESMSDLAVDSMNAAVVDAAEEAIEELGCVMRLSGTVLNVPAPEHVPEPI